MSRTARTLAATLLTLTAITTACAPGTGSHARPKIGVVELFSNPFFAEARAGMEKAAAEGGADLVINNANADSAKEAGFVTTYLTQKVDAIVLSAVSPTGSLATLHRIKAAHVPVVCYDTCVNPPDDQQLVDAFVTSDNRGLGATTGRQAATYIKDELGGSAKAIMLTCEEFDVCKQRRAGLDAELAGAHLDLLAEQEGYQVDKATPIANSMLAAHPDTQVIIVENEDAILAAATAVKARGLTGKVAIFGIDIDPQVALLITQPATDVKWTTGQSPFDMGYQAVQAAIARAHGRPAGDFYHYTPSPTFSSADPASARNYLDSHHTN
ncbi:substrate-binding domain-containing protein [Amycolatopsis granulosa]|uniref:substrate-binding domain-containing protein n=1 Tax=Amycolatopsis granulosa TaxID=185684 RepID=UPI001422FE8E|nr:substrate-binding domain-containing protein [Amycolatopsis granulosa]NIH85285.1 ABC-type sugar transport system substrate-binding protein [Amycolatopsis granulosa]